MYHGCSIRKSNIIFILWLSCWSWPSTQWAAVRTCQLVIREPPHMGPLGQQPSCDKRKCRDISLDPWIFGCCLFNFKWRLPFLLFGYSINTCQGYSCSSAGASKLPCIILLLLRFLVSLSNSLVSLLSLVCLKNRRSPQLQFWFYKCSTLSFTLQYKIFGPTLYLFKITFLVMVNVTGLIWSFIFYSKLPYYTFLFSVFWSIR